MPGLREHAEYELKASGLFDSDADYGGMVPEAVLALIDVFSSQGHSGGSASLVLTIFNKLAHYQNLTPLTDNPEEWHFHEENISGVKGGFWQNKRNGEAFSNDGGKTYYLLSEGGNNKKREPLHTSITFTKEKI